MFSLNTTANHRSTIGVFYSREPDADGYLYSTKQFRDFLPELVIAFQKKNIRLVLLCKEQSYVGGGLFSSYWLSHETKKGQFIHVNKTIKPHLIYDKGHFAGNDSFVKVINTPELSKLGRNKYAQSILFSSLMPKSVLIIPGEQHRAKTLLDIFATDKVIMKPVRGNGGRDIKLVDTARVFEQTLVEPMLCQEFIETASGIPGMTNGRHDLRLYVINGEAKLASIRIPKKNSYLANTSQGGKIEFFSVTKVPLEPQKIMRQVDNKLKKFGPRYYSVDFLFDGHVWWFIELNDRPGIPACFQSDLVPAFHEAFVIFLKKELVT